MYITYLTNDSQTNTASSYPGIGTTKEEAQANSCYWANQQPWVRTVAASRAPRWAQRTAVGTRYRYLESVDISGFTPDGKPASLSKDEERELYALHDQMCHG